MTRTSFAYRKGEGRKVNFHRVLFSYPFLRGCLKKNRADRCNERRRRNLEVTLSFLGGIPKRMVSKRRSERERKEIKRKRREGKKEGPTFATNLHVSSCHTSLSAWNSRAGGPTESFSTYRYSREYCRHKSVFVIDLTIYSTYFIFTLASSFKRLRYWSNGYFQNRNRLSSPKIVFTIRFDIISIYISFLFYKFEKTRGIRNILYYINKYLYNTIRNSILALYFTPYFFEFIVNISRIKKITAMSFYYIKINIDCLKRWKY